MIMDPVGHGTRGSRNHACRTNSRQDDENIVINFWASTTTTSCTIHICKATYKCCRTSSYSTGIRSGNTGKRA